MVHPKQDLRARYPYPIDARTGEPNYCADATHGGMTSRVGHTLFGVTNAWMKNGIIVLCPATFTVRRDPILEQVKIGTCLDMMDFSARLLLHELFHLANPGVCIVSGPWGPVDEPSLLITLSLQDHKPWSFNYDHLRKGPDLRSSSPALAPYKHGC